MSSRVTIPAYARTIQQRFIPVLPISWMRRFSEELLREVYGPIANQITGGL